MDGGRRNHNTMMGALTNLRDVSRRHLLATLFAFFVGLFIVAPQLIFIANEGNNYKGLYMMMNSEAEWYYLARMHEVYDEGKIGNPFLFEHKFYGPIFISPGGETILAIPGKLLNISIPTLNLIYKFLLPAITFLLLYALIFRLTASAAWSIAGGLFFLVGSTWLYANNLAHLLQGDKSFYTEFFYNRPVHPQFDGVLFFSYLNVLLTIFERSNLRGTQGEKKQRRNLGNDSSKVGPVFFPVLSNLLGGAIRLSFYTYFYSLTFVLALNFVVALLWFFFGKKKEVWNLALVTLGGLLVGAPALWAIYEAAKHIDYPQITAYSTQFGHIPEISKNGLLVALFFVIYLFRTKAHRAIGVIHDHALFLGALFITTFVVVNQQVLTGISLHSGHYHHNFNIPIFIIVLMFLASVVTRNFLCSRNTGSENTRSNLEESIPKVRPCVFWRDRVFRALPWILSVVFIATGTTIQYFSYINDAPQASEDQRYMAALSWLRDNTPKDSVIMANERLSNLVTIFTENNVMWSSGATNYLMPPARVRFTPENLLKSSDFLHDIKQYRVDYILWDQRYDPDWNIERFHLPIKFSGEDLTIYEFP